MSPEDDEVLRELEKLTDPERFTLELRWYEGRMLPYAEWLDDFVMRHRNEIVALAENSRDTAALVWATKLVIVRKGTMHMANELKDQKREIENELWYRGERGDHDRSKILLEWTEAHGASWRRWRLREYLFAADRCANRIVSLLLTPETAESSIG